MTEFRLQSVDFGWRDVESPDDITFEIVREDSALTLSASLEQLATIHGCGTNECDCEFFIGTGSPISTKPSDGIITLKIETVRIDFPKGELIDQIENLIRAVFDEKDQYGSSHDIEEKLRQLDNYTAEYYCSSNLKELYEGSDNTY